MLHQLKQDTAQGQPHVEHFLLSIQKVARAQMIEHTAVFEPGMSTNAT